MTDHQPQAGQPPSTLLAQDRPDAANILRTVADFLSTLQPKLQGEDKYHTQVSVYLLGIVARELSSHAALPAAAAALQAEILAGSGADPTAWLARQIRSGALDDRFADVLTLLLAAGDARAGIVRPQTP